MKNREWLLTLIICISSVSLIIGALINRDYAVDLIKEELAESSPLDSTRELTTIVFQGEDEFIRVVKTNNDTREEDTFKISEITDKNKANEINKYKDRFYYFIYAFSIEVMIVVLIPVVLYLKEKLLPKKKNS